jgi:hypothetical protein
MWLTVGITYSNGAIFLWAIVSVRLRSQEAVLTPGTDLQAALTRKFRYHQPEHKVILRNDLNLAICYH